MSNILKVTIEKVEDKFEAAVHTVEGGTSKVFDTFEEANAWVIERSGEHGPEAPEEKPGDENQSSQETVNS